MLGAFARRYPGVSRGPKAAQMFGKLSFDSLSLFCFPPGALGGHGLFHNAKPVPHIGDCCRFRAIRPFRLFGVLSLRLGGGRGRFCLPERLATLHCLSRALLRELCEVRLIPGSRLC